jgi:hypothetical protein
VPVEEGATISIETFNVPPELTEEESATVEPSMSFPLM